MTGFLYRCLNCNCATSAAGHADSSKCKRCKGMSREEVFWSKVDKNGPIFKESLGQCWTWTGLTFRNTYGQFLYMGRPRLTHRISYYLIIGHPLEGGSHIDHICRNIICCNPTHLRPTTNKENQENQSSLNRNSTTGMRGVSLVKSRWQARVKHNGKNIHLGYFSTKEEAAEVARLKRLELFTHNDEDRRAHVS